MSRLPNRRTRTADARLPRVVGLVLVLLLILGIGAGLAAKARAIAPLAAQVTLSASEGPPGTNLVMRGRGYDPTETVDIYEDTNLTTTVAADGTGAFAIQLKICTCFGPATIQVKGVGETSGLSAQAPFTVRTNWPQFHMTPNHVGSNRFENVISVGGASALTELWRGPTNNFFTYSSAIAYGGSVFAGSGDHNLYVFAQNGCGTQTVCPALWTATMGGYIDSTPAAAGRLVLVGSDAGDVAAFPAAGCGLATCAPVWTAVTGGSIHGSPAIDRGFAYVVSGDGLLHVYRAAGCGSATCSDVWAGALPGLIPTGSSAAVAGGRVYVGAGNSVVAFDAVGCGRAVCQPMWVTPTGGNVFSSPAVFGNQVFVGSEDHSLYALDSVTGSVLWSAATGDVVQSSPAVAEGLVFVGSFDGGVYAFEKDTGALAWKSGTGGPVFASPAVANHVLFVQSNDGYLYAYDARGCGQAVCSRLRRWPVAGEGSPGVSDAQVFVTGQDGSLHTIGFPGLATAGTRGG